MSGSMFFIEMVKEGSSTGEFIGRIGLSMPIFTVPILFVI